MSDLVPVEYGRRMLAEADTVQDVAKVIDYAEAAREAARRVKLHSRRSTRVRRAVSRRAARRREDAKGRPWLWARAEIRTVRDFDITDDQASRWQRVAAISEDTYRVYLDSIDGEDLGRGGLLRYAQTGLLTSSESPEWYTPARYIEAARDVLGGIDLDPASCAAANETVKATRWFGPADDSLNRDWCGRVWMNPPYGRSAPQGCDAFVPKLAAEHEAGRVQAAVLLVSAHSTDTRWFAHLWPHTLCFSDHRLVFWNTDGNDQGPTFGTAFAYLGPDPKRFAERFGEFGAVVRRWP